MCHARGSGRGCYTGLPRAPTDCLAGSTLAVLLFLRQPGIERIVDARSSLERHFIAGANQADTFANQVQPSGRWFHENLLHRIGLVDDPSHPMEHWVVEFVFAQKGVERAVSLVVR